TSGQPILRDWIGRSDSSAYQRIVILQEAGEILQKAGPLGTGPNATKPLLTDTLAPYAHQAHDDYVALVVERGVLGGVALFVLICAIWFRSSQALGGRMRDAFQRVVPRREPLIGALLGLAAAASYYEVIHFRHVWTLLAVLAMAVAAAVASLLIWVVASPAIRAVFFHDLTTALVAWAGLKATSRLFVITAKAASQGTGDLPGSNWLIFLEELMFLPAYAVALMFGLRGGAGIIAALILSDVA